MQLDKENMKKIRWLIAFAILLYLGVQNLHIVISTVRVLLGFLFPFIIGFGIAFILNIPMKFIEHHLFGKALKQEKKTAQKLARPVSLVLSICFVICIIVIVMLVVVPELGATFVNIAKKIEENIPVFQKWIDNVFGNNPEVVKWAQSLDIEPGKIIDSVLGVLKNGVNNIVSSTVSITMGLLTTAMNVSIGFVFACYVLLQKEKLLQQIKKAMYAMFPEKPVRYLAHVWNLANRIFSSFITGQCIEAVILGSMFALVGAVCIAIDNDKSFKSKIIVLWVAAFIFFILPFASMKVKAHVENQTTSSSQSQDLYESPCDTTERDNLG